MKKTVLALAFFYLSLLNFSFAQSIHFGKVTVEELNSTMYEKDSSASAAILYDGGESIFNYLENYGFRLETKRTIRVKIYNKAGYDWGDISIPLYKEDIHRAEIIKDVKGYVYNLENGMIRRDELDKKDIYEENVSEKWRNIKFALPNIKEGTVLEYSYTVVSPFLFKPDDWVFQYNIPVRWSEYTLTVPAFYEYMILRQGYFDLAVNEMKLMEHKHQLGSYTYNNMKYHWAMKDIPAYRDEQFMTTREDYIAKMMFQLSKVNYPGRHVKDYMTTWPQLAKDLAELTDFGKNIKKNDTKEIVSSLTNGWNSEKEKALAIYKHILQNYAWNEKFGFSPSLTLKQLLKEKQGNCTDINLLLLNMLKQAGIEANPVLLSTRNHGKITTKFPLIDQFNYTIVFAHLDGQGMLLDATDPDLPFGMISEACMNGYGFIVEEGLKEERWINLTQQGLHFLDFYIDLKYDEEETAFIAQVRENYKEYAALQARKIYRKDKEKLYHFSTLEEYEVQHLEDKDKPLSISYSTTYPVDVLGDLVYISPFVMAEEENPFNSPERYFPVDYGLRKGVRTYFNLIIPEGYELEEWPEDTELKLDDAVSFVVKSQRNHNHFQVVSLLQIHKTTIPVEQYKALRTLYTEMLSKQMEKIVLRKTATE